MMEMLKRPLTVVAHDAGAANHIFAWLGNEQPTMYLEGPSLLMWQSRIHNIGRVSSTESTHKSKPNSELFLLAENGLAEAILGASTVVTGTGWESNLEHNARKLARKQGIRSIAVIDHWTNYGARFIRNGEQVLPDEIWVSDSYAAEIAQVTFPTVKVTQLPNAYLLGLVAEVEALQEPAATQGNDRVLYVLEPIRHSWGELDEPGEFLALDYFMAHRQRAPISVDAEIRLRPHPSDSPGKYEGWLYRHANSSVSLDKSATLAEGLAWANVVAGCQTYAMVLALACGRTVISTIPAWAPPCVLPHGGIVKLAKRDQDRSFAFD